MEKLELIISIAGLAIILMGLLGYLFLQSRVSQKKIEPAQSSEDISTQIPTQASIDPIVMTAGTEEPKKAKEDFSTQEPISPVLKTPGNLTDLNLSHDSNIDMSEEMLEQLQSEISAASRLAVQAGPTGQTAQTAQTAQTGGRAVQDPFSNGQWSEIVKKTFKQRTDLNQQKVSDRQRRLKGFVIIHVMAPQGLSFYGGDVLEVLTNLGLRFGEQQIFHKFNDQGQKLFSISQAVEPGWFDINNMTLISTKGLSCFFDLASAPNPKQAFRGLLACVHELAHYLRAEILDENHQLLTQEAIAKILKRIKSDEVGVGIAQGQVETTEV